ncbi:hypothetical protein [Clostridium rectalis]|uniref:hypothetical protein n=1 Tax=Clostridium rectalis TaxID=2040295 RepID=UPI000F632793|nr:hypothetical protein [Clostridium rectalis]
MKNIVIFLIISLVLLICLDCFVGDKYFTREPRTYYFKILRNIFNILVVTFMFLQRKELLSINKIGNMLIFACIITAIYNVFKMFFSIDILKREDLL